MFLKHIEMSGFKSFPEKTEIELSGLITGVVGPNGSGKSNVSDAVRWVLGEQSAKALRGSVMPDVIFAGTQSRKPRSYCEVTLIFDNADGRVGAEFTEVQVTRKLHRSGESEYSINGAKCRLKDILNLFRDTGIGKEGYSIIGQGRIDDILSEKSSDRRRVFEEASGIMKFRVHKEEAERKLERTRFNLVRVEDILVEQALRVEPLKNQADDAAAYLEVASRLKHLDINLFLHNYDRTKERIEKLKADKQGLLEERAQIESEIEKLNQRHAGEQSSLRELEQAGDALSESLSGSMAEIERTEGEIRLCGERIANNEKEKQRIAQEIADAEERGKANQKSRETNTRKAEKAAQELSERRAEADRLGAELKGLTGAFQDKIKHIEAVQNAKLKSVEQLGEIKNQIFAIEEKQRNAARRIEETEQRIEKAEKEQQHTRQALLAAEGELSALSGNAAKLRDAFNEKVFELKRLEEQAAKDTAALDEAKRELAAGEASARLLSDMRNSFEGYMDSVRKLMLSAKNNPELSKRIMGVVVDRMNVPAQFEAAVEACLGAALQNVIVGDEYDAKALIAHLREHRMGRVTFLPVKALKPRALSVQERADIKEPGVLGIASELVACDTDVQPAIDFLLGRTVIVEDSDTAIRISRKTGTALRVVTLEGDVFNPGGSITGGSMRREAGGLLSRERREEELKQRAEELLKQAASLETAMKQKAAHRAQAGEEIEEARKALQQNEIALAACREKQQSLSSAIAEAATALEALQAEKEDAQRGFDEARIQLEQAAGRQSAMQQSGEAEIQEFALMEEEYNKNAALIEEKKQQLHDAEIRIAELFRENAAILSDNMRLEQETRDIEKSMAARRKTLELGAETEENLYKIKAQLEALLAQKTANLEGLKTQQGDMLKNRGTLQKGITEREEQLASLRAQLDEFTEKRIRMEVAAEKADAGLVASQNRLWDTYQLTYANVLPLRAPINVGEAQAEAEQLRERLRDMGSINPNAIEEYQQLTERIASLTAQKDDLMKAEQDLHVLIASLLVEMRRTFKTSFEQINKHFGATFKELFGGRAELVLEEGDIMECDIDIIAEPPGKRMQRLSLLSGGEKALTAISLLFALLKINPSPVCILDEIDTALDDANTDKFAEYLSRYSQKMQFIVISHRKPTMAVCDALYGFAMEEKGVSKLLSVKLNQ